MTSTTFKVAFTFAVLATVFISEIQGQTPAPAPRKRREQSCEVLVTSENSAGVINSLDQTNTMEGAVQCDWVIIGKPGSKLKLNFLDHNNIKTRSSDATPTSMACNDCETECCNSVELIEGGVSTRYCCARLPSEVNTGSNAVIVRLHRDILSEKSKGFVLNWSE